MAVKVVFLTSGTTWTVPSDWNSADNSIETITKGGNGASGVGGVGGNYKKYTNVSLTPSSTATYDVAAGTHTGLGTAVTSYSGGSAVVLSGNAWGGGAAGPGGAGGNATTAGGGAGGTAGAGSWTSTHNASGAASVATAAPGAGGTIGSVYGGGSGYDGRNSATGAAGIIVVTYNAQNIQSGAGAASGVGAATGIGGAIKPAAGASAGAGAALATGQAISLTAGSGIGAAAGVSAATGAAVAYAAGVGASSGTATGNGLTVNTVSGVGVSAGVATLHAGVYPPSRILIGKLPNGGYGLRVSQSGYDAGADPVDNERLIFSSDWPEVMPVYQVGSFAHRTTAQQGTVVTTLIDFTSLGFIPFVDFIVKPDGNALPAGSDTYDSSRYYERRGMNVGLNYWSPLVGSDASGYLRLNITSSQLRAESFVRSLSGNASQGLPRTWTIYYVIYRKQAF